MKELKKGEGVVRIPSAAVLLTNIIPPDDIGFSVRHWLEIIDGDWLEIEWLDGSRTIEEGNDKLQKLETWGDQCR
jgi:hypothetical protein